jgi:hypothetical protein
LVLGAVESVAAIDAALFQLLGLGLHRKFTKNNTPGAFQHNGNRARTVNLVSGPFQPGDIVKNGFSDHTFITGQCYGIAVAFGSAPSGVATPDLG